MADIATLLGETADAAHPADPGIMRSTGRGDAGLGIDAAFTRSMDRRGLLNPGRLVFDARAEGDVSSSGLLPWKAL